MYTCYLAPQTARFDGVPFSTGNAAQRMGYVWLIAERSELLKQYLCRLLVRIPPC
jgi:hypothetical protein